MNTFENKYGFTEEEWNSCIKVLHGLKDKPFNNPDNPLFGTLIKKITKTAKKQLSGKEDRKNINLGIIKESTIAQNALQGKTFYGEESKTLEPHFTKISSPKNCYSCNTEYDEIHSFYHRLCPKCANLNFKNRSLKIDLNNRNVILTGGRVKVGFATALKLLRCNANLTITTRFPAIAFDTFQKEKDYHIWKDNLIIYGLDLRIINEVEKFIQYYYSNNESLDILINNAAQTIQYDQKYYTSIISSENKLLEKHSDQKLINTQYFKTLNLENKNALLAVKTEINRFGQPVDKREKNSWNSKLEEIDILELLEVNLINQISPFILIKKFTPLLKQSTFEDKFIINVTSSEGQFSYKNKTRYHPHTNMTKAALNMLTHTSAKDYAADNIFLNGVDVGWISTGAIEPLREKQFQAGYIPPLDPVDGAARILHPIHEKMVNKNALFGKLIKNYQIEDW